MWTAKFKIRHDDCWLVPKTSKFNISAIGIPLNSYEKKGIKYHNGMCFLKGKKEDKLNVINNTIAQAFLERKNKNSTIIEATKVPRPPAKNKTYIETPSTIKNKNFCLFSFKIDIRNNE